jgi:large subunit ribosomal protein L25
MVDLSFIGVKRKNLGTGNARALRRAGKIPAVVYGFDKNYKLTLIYKDFLKVYLKGGFMCKLINIIFGEEKLKVISKEVQVDPVTDNPIHVDFQIIKDNVPIKVAVLVKAINEDKSPGIKRGGILNVVNKYVDLNCIPGNIPTSLQVDISGFEIGKSIHINEIQLPNGAALVSKNNFTVLTIAGRVDENQEDQVVQEEDHTSENKETKEESK